MNILISLFFVGAAGFLVYRLYLSLITGLALPAGDKGHMRYCRYASPFMYWQAIVGLIGLSVVMLMAAFFAFVIPEIS